MRDFVVERAIRVLEANLTDADYDRMELEESAYNSRIKADNFIFYANKKDILKALDKIDELDLLTFSEKKYLAHIMNLLEDCITEYIRQSEDDSKFTNWDCCEEVGNLSSNLSESEYLYYAFKYYNLMKDSIWNDNFNALMDSSEALEVLAFMH